MRQRLQPMGIDATQIRFHQAARNCRRVFLRQIMRDEKPAAKRFRRLFVNVKRALYRFGICLIF
jgi:hypothetical protein